MRIAICDDETSIRAELSEQLTRLQDEYNERFEIVQFDNGKDLCARLKDLDLDLVLLDYKMSGIDGVETAKAIYDANIQKVKIIFITSFDNCARHLFRLNVIDFIMKPVTTEKLRDSFDYYYEKFYQRKHPTFKYMIKKEERIVPISQIIYFETGKDHSTIIHLNGVAEPSEFRRLFRDVWKEIKQYNCFAFPNRSYIINLSYARNIKSDSMELFGETIFIGRKNRQDTKDRYIKFLNKQSNGENLI